MHQSVHCEHGSNEVHEDLHKSDVAVCHHLLQYRADIESKPALVNQSDMDWDMVPVALN